MLLPNLLPSTITATAATVISNFFQNIILCLPRTHGQTLQLSKMTRLIENYNSAGPRLKETKIFDKYFLPGMSYGN